MRERLNCKHCIITHTTHRFRTILLIKYFTFAFSYRMWILYGLETCVCLTNNFLFFLNTDSVRTKQSSTHSIFALPYSVQIVLASEIVANCRTKFIHKLHSILRYENNTLYTGSVIARGSTLRTNHNLSIRRLVNV